MNPVINNTLNNKMEVNKYIDVFTIYDYVTYVTNTENCLTILWDDTWKELDDFMKNEHPLLLHIIIYLMPIIVGLIK